jgi:hypothetical protein
MTKVQAVGFGEGARESVSRQYIHDDDDMDMLLERVVAVVEEVLMWLIGRVGNMIDLEVVGKV